MKRILITGGTTSLAFKVKMLMKDTFDILLGDAREIPAILGDHFINLPKVSSRSYPHEMLKIALDHDLKYILPLYKEEIFLLSDNLSLFSEYEVKILIPTPAILKHIDIDQIADKSQPLILLEEGYDLMKQSTTELKLTGLGVHSNNQFQFTLVAYSHD